jgi:HK97 family phage major capsid protein
MNPNELHARTEALLDEMQTITDTWGSDRSTWPTGQVERYERLDVAVKRNMVEVDAMARQESRADKVAALRSAAADPRNIESGDGATGGPDLTPRRRTDPWSTGSGDDLTRMDTPTGLVTRAHDAIEYGHGLTPAGRSLLAGVVDADPNGHAAALVIAATSDAYRSAFTKVMADSTRGHLLWTPAEREAYARVENMRAAMSLTDANGGYLVPFSLDPTIVLANDGAASPLRQIARVETTTTDTWNGVASAGVTAEWLAEATEAADASPAFSRISITPHKGAAYLVASYEVAGDSNVAAQLPALIADARARQEAAAFITGTGNGQPKGVVTAVAAVTASRVAPTTGGTFSAASEVYKVWDALPARARQSSSVAWVTNNGTISRIRQFDVYGGSSFIADLAAGQPARLIGAPLFEASSMDSAVTTGSNILLAGDFRAYCIVDRLGTVVVEQPVITGAGNRPTGQRGWFAYWRTGGDVTDASQFRVMKL